MTEFPLHLAPGFRLVVLEQIRIVGLLLRREAAMLAAALAGLTLLELIQHVSHGETIDAEPVGMLVVALAAFLFPFAVWRGANAFEQGYLWTLPVDRRRHAFAKLFAGAVWLAAGVAAIMAWLIALALLSGGSVGVEETRLLLVREPDGNGVAGPGSFEPFRWTTPAWQWPTPFTGALVAYLFGSALVLGVRHPLRWMAGAILGLVALATVGEMFVWDGLVGDVMQDVLGGPYGLDHALTGGADLLSTEVRLPNGETQVVWRGRPSFEHWSQSTLVWGALGAACLWAAAFRHREQ